jgi:transcriptional regulator GlxA family with amidase domain
MGRDDWLRTVDSYLERCFAECTPPRVGELAMILDLEIWTLSRHFSRATGIGLLAYMRAKKLEHAVTLLVSSEGPVEAIATRAGFGSRSSFFREFAAAFAISPAEFRSRHQSHP